MAISPELLHQELTFSTSRSGGPGGQNVNKVNSKVTLSWDVSKSSLISEDDKVLILRKLASYISNKGILNLTVQESRSQVQNKELALIKLSKLIQAALIKPKIRKPTKPTKASVQKRKSDKKRNAEKKKWRKNSD